MPNDTTTAPVQTSLGALRQPPVPEQGMTAVRIGFMDTQGFALMQRVSTALAASTLVPKDFQNNLPNCLIALEMAQRIGASPLMVMQNLYIVHGRPGWSAKFLIASFNQCGRFAAVRFEWSSAQGKDEWGCRAWSTEKATGEKIQGPLITIGLAKKEGWYEKSGSKWKTIPELMLMYRAAAWMINTHAPEISMGLNTAEELGDVYDASRSPEGTFTIDALKNNGGSTLEATTTTTSTTTTEATGATIDVDKSTGEIKTDTKDPLAEFKEQLANATDAESLDFCRGLAKDLPENLQAEAVSLISKRSAEIAAAAKG